MNEHILSKMADPIHNFHLPRYQEIPDVGLYLEQASLNEKPADVRLRKVCGHG